MLPIFIGGLMNKKLIPLVVQLKQNNREILTGINQNDAGWDAMNEEVCSKCPLNAL